MSEGSDQDKTEEPTARKLSKAREDGQVARSSELPAAVIVIGALLMLLTTGGWLVKRMAAVRALAAGQEVQQPRRHWLADAPFVAGDLLKTAIAALITKGLSQVRPGVLLSRS